MKCMEIEKKTDIITTGIKGQLISKAIYGLLTSPKKRTDEFVLFAFLLFMTNKSNSSVHFLENLRLAKLLFGFISLLPNDILNLGNSTSGPY